MWKSNRAACSVRNLPRFFEVIDQTTMRNFQILRQRNPATLSIKFFSFSVKLLSSLLLVEYFVHIFQLT